MKHYSNEYIKMINKQVDFVDNQLKRNLANQVTRQLFYKAVAKTFYDVYNRYDEDAYFVKEENTFTAYSKMVDLNITVSELFDLWVWGYSDENADKKTYFSACKDVILGVIYLLNYLEEKMIVACQQGKYIDELISVLNDNYDDKAISAKFDHYKRENKVGENFVSLMMGNIEENLGKMSLKELFEEYPNSMVS